jgi:hypothetical protein
LTASERALKARLTGGVASIPHITFVLLDAVFAQELAVYLLKVRLRWCSSWVSTYPRSASSWLGLTENAP